MMHGRNNGKKLMAVRIVKHAFDIIKLTTDSNPIQILVDAVINGGPREDATRIGSAGVVRRQAVDVSPMRRVNQVRLARFQAPLTGHAPCPPAAAASLLHGKLVARATRRVCRPLAVAVTLAHEDAGSHAAAAHPCHNAQPCNAQAGVQALYLLTTGAREAAFRNIKTIAECLADELINAAKGSSNRHARWLCIC